MNQMLLEVAVNTGDNGGMTKFIIIGVVCVVAIAAVAILGFLSKKNK
ncbi:MAG: hypothetical protein IJA27_03605 [Lachnospiraceae bacterium]|nr:hypothetical protein [Lachnospiraceae bacterium]